ncbi:TetR/AcrR family transcriptional regulator [Saccharopolyspora sp. HNM0983]|uniref:TetR/AcrR family transcriptional regulator n=2 Tax=Saccharopolyspora montiporae TaxID=2781240 RepID=A0A929B9P3_9PSEU|nr:TetR/AcrR family transcriptional regulator [Saccharopolyspora sp. HNM0983]
MGSGRTGGHAWQWGRTAHTRGVLLQAAREVFGEHGYSESGVAEVVGRAGSSVGSLYHHFGGKAGLFLALWEDYQAAQEQSAIAAVASARGDGEQDGLALFNLGARAFLEGSWQHRDLVRLFMDGDAPPGFELVRRTRGREWVRQNAVLLGAGSDPVDRVTVAVLTTAIGEASREVATCSTKREANEVLEAALRLIRRLDPLDVADEET